MRMITPWVNHVRTASRFNLVVRVLYSSRTRILVLAAVVDRRAFPPAYPHIRPSLSLSSEHTPTQIFELSIMAAKERRINEHVRWE